METNTLASETKLLSLDSPLYLKRLARELNALPDGFYYSGHRYTRARFKNGTLEARYIRECGCAAWTATGHGGPIQPFSDAYGRSVCASRRA